jgi:hypothetical protein
VTWNPYPRLPLGAVRDLLVITRALYRALLAANPNDARLLALTDIGNILKSVLAAARAHPGTSDHLSAWAAAEQASRALCALVDESIQLGPVIAATARRISRPGSMG